jgi:hypothetical protein
MRREGEEHHLCSRAARMGLGSADDFLVAEVDSIKDPKGKHHGALDLL